MQTHKINIYDSISNKEVKRFNNGWLVAIAHKEGKCEYQKYDISIK